MVKAAVINRSTGTVDTEKFGPGSAEKVCAFHKTLPEYSVTPLRDLKALAEYLGLKKILVKDESFRFGLNAFKGLGGSYAIHSIAGESKEKHTFVTATDGNHGRGVAWAAARLGHEAYVFLPKGTAQERLLNIRKLGAHAEITDMCYDDTVRYAAALAKEKGWILVQDTSWDGYEEIPTAIMQGYTTIGLEIIGQLDNTVPTHVFLQAGVGSMAGAMAAFLKEYYKEKCPKIITVEPNGADCIYQTAEADDGSLHFCGEDMHSIMAGLCCGEPCPIAWDLLKQCADFAITCPDHVAADGMRMLGNPLKGDERIISGESGAVTSGITAELMLNEEYAGIREMLGLNKDSVVVCISTEGDTDRKNYRDVVWHGKYSR